MKNLNESEEIIKLHFYLRFHNTENFNLSAPSLDRALLFPRETRLSIC